MLKKHIWSKAAYRYRQPVSFGPSPGPRQPQNALPDVLSYAAQHQEVYSIRFKTSRTYLQTLFPTSQFSFTSPGTVAQASLICCSLKQMKWLGETGYNHCGLYIHGVQYKKRDGSTLHGTFMPILFESLTDPIITGREEIAAPKWGCDIDITSASADNSKVTMSWRGTTFVELEWNGLADSGATNGEAKEAKLPKPTPDDGMLMYRYVPAVGEPGKADAEYAVFDPFPKPEDTNGASKFESKNPEWKKVAKEASIKINAGSWNDLPTIHHVAQGLADVPVYEILEATVAAVPQVGDVRGAHRVE